jgi:hypothetical protein
MAGTSPDRIKVNFRGDIALEQIELRMRSMKFNPAHDSIGRAAVKLSHGVVVGNYIPCDPPLKHYGHVSPLYDVVFDKSCAGFVDEVHIRVMLAGLV